MAADRGKARNSLFRRTGEQRPEHGDLRVPEALTAWTNLIDREDIATVGDDLADETWVGAAGPAEGVAPNQFIAATTPETA